MTKLEAEELLGVPIENIIRYYMKINNYVTLTFYKNHITICWCMHPQLSFYAGIKVFTYEKFIETAKELNKNYKFTPKLEY